MMKNLVLILAGLLSCPVVNADEPRFAVLRPADFEVYVDRFNREDEETQPQYIPNDSAWDFLRKNIPFFDCPDRDVLTTYYFRWWTFRKHIRQTPSGFVFTEFLPDVPWAGKYNTISCAAAHHIYEGRWLRDRRFVNDYAHFWFTDGNPRLYSFWAADALLEYYKVSRQEAVLRLLPALAENYRAWEKGWVRNGYRVGLNPDGLFCNVDDRDGMEMQIGGSGERPSINSYMYGEAEAIAGIADLNGDAALAREFRTKAAQIRQSVQKSLWDASASFFKTRSERDGSLADVRELQGYTPWYFHLPEEGRGYESAWRFVRSTEGFRAPYGLTTAEQRHPRFAISYEGHECQWNGPVWPYATSITLTALANVLNDYRQNEISKTDYFELFLQYTRSHRRVREDGCIVPWIDENQNPYTGDWISRTRLENWENGTWSASKGGRERGKDYNHSTYCDLLIAGLIGIRPQASDRVVINPLLPDGTWEWFCLDGVAYQGHSLTVLYDRTGSRYGHGQGFVVLVDGQLRSQTATVQRVEITL